MKTALITGGTRGIGKAISVHLHTLGYKVIATYMGNHHAAATFHQETGIPILSFDAGDYSQSHAAIQSIYGTHGEIDVLVNNAGITRDGFLHKLDPKDWDQVLKTNLTSCFNLCHCIIPKMRERSYGRIINISSINAQKGQMGQVNYAAAKAGILGFTKALALECASKNITVNAIAPGYIDTEMVASIPESIQKTILSHIPVGRFGKSEEIAAMVAFLVQESTAFITGATFSVNGGQLCL